MCFHGETDPQMGAIITKPTLYVVSSWQGKGYYEINFAFVVIVTQSSRNFKYLTLQVASSWYRKGPYEILPLCQRHRNSKISAFQLKLRCSQFLIWEGTAWNFNFVSNSRILTKTALRWPVLGVERDNMKLYIFVIDIVTRKSRHFD